MNTINIWASAPNKAGNEARVYISKADRKLLHEALQLPEYRNRTDTQSLYRKIFGRNIENNQITE